MKPSLPEFATELIEALAEQSSFDWNFDGHDKLYDDSGNTCSLTNLYDEYCRARHSDRPKLLRTYASIPSTARRRDNPVVWELARKNIYVVVRSRYDRSAEAQLSGAASPVTWPFVEDLELKLVYDWGEALQHVTEDQAKMWGQSSEAILEQAIQNMSSLRTPRWERLMNGVFRLVSEVTYQESFLLVDRVMDQLPFASSMVCMPVNRDVLLAANGNSTTALNALLDKAQRCFMKMPRPISGTMLVRKDGRWQAYKPGPEVAARAADLKRLTLAKAYSSQQSELQRRAMAQDQDLFIASYGLMEWPQRGGALRSSCSWAEGAPSSLPQTDFVALVRILGDVAGIELVRWEQIESVCGHRLKKSQDDPPRFIVEDFPNCSELKVLEANAEQLPKIPNFFAQIPNHNIRSGKLN